MSRLDKIDVGVDGTLYIRFMKDDGRYHRTVVEPGSDPVRQMAFVNSHLTQMGHQPVPVADRSTIDERVRTEHTAEIIQRYREKRGIENERTRQIGSPIGLLASTAGAATPTSTAKDSGVGSRTGSSEKEG